MFKLVILFAVLALSLHCEGKRFSRCELVQELRRQGFDESLMSNWVCLIENESNRYTDIVGTMNTDGSRDYGLFQINDRYWCNEGSIPGKDCNVACDQLLTDDITVAATCAKKVYSRQQFDAWNGWKNKCQGGLPDISGC